MTRRVLFSFHSVRSAALLLTLAAAGGLSLATEAPGPSASSLTAEFKTEFQPRLQQYCYPCHGTVKPAADVSLAAFTDPEAVTKDPATWRRVLKQLQAKSMPPAGVPHPSDADRDRLVRWIQSALASAPGSPNPGRVLIHRLSRTEYNNTLRDLLGVDSHPADQFPADGGGGAGFDNDADTLFLPPILMERYLAAARSVLDQAKPARIFWVHPGKTMPPAVAARQILHDFASRALRRPVTTAELDRLMALYAARARKGAPFEASVKTALKAVLVSPEFLYRIEKPKPKGPQRIDDYELASRLSYFLWASMPDEPLFELARRGRLHDPVMLDRQVTRMLANPKAWALSDSFVGQWLRVRDLYTTAQPDPGRYPAFSPSLRDAMYGETIDFCDDLLRHDGSLLDLIESRTTFLNEELAQFYGIPGVKGPQRRRVYLDDHRRGGVLTMASVLTVTSYPERTSPVLRGKWVLEQLLGTAIPPPPPNAGGLPADDAPVNGQSFRQRLEQHRSKPECALCHSKMDPLGFGLENFDAIGRWRTTIGGAPVDASGVLAGGEKFAGPVELKQHLLADKQEFARNLVEKMLAYALGRGLESYDQPTVDRITAAVQQSGYRSGTLIREIVKSYPFQYRDDGG